MKVGTFATLALLVAAGCDPGDDAPLDASADHGADLAPDVCSSHPNTCNLDDRNPLAPWDCCPASQTCCALCYDADLCGQHYECRPTCPETLPCSGVPGSGGFSCTYDPEDFASTVYCPVPGGALPDTVVECSATCTTGVVCPFDTAAFGDAALCCPEATTCVTGGFGLPFCE